LFKIIFKIDFFTISSSFIFVMISSSFIFYYYFLLWKVNIELSFLIESESMI
jgi:hypothetical protein